MPGKLCEQMQSWLFDGDPAHHFHATYRLSLPDLADCKSDREYPSLFQQATNFAKATGAVVSTAVRGEVIIRSAKEQAEYLAICEACEKFDPTQGRCTICGCYARWKARIASEHCPLDPPKW